MFKEMFRHYWKKAAAVIAAGAGYSLWLWHSSAMEPVLFISNMFSVISLLFLLVALFGTMHNVHALAVFSYGFRYMNIMLRNAWNRDALTEEPMISYADYVQSYRKWTSVPMSYLFFIIFMVLSLLVWFLF